MCGSWRWRRGEEKEKLNKMGLAREPAGSDVCGDFTYIAISCILLITRRGVWGGPTNTGAVKREEYDFCVPILPISPHKAV